MIGFDGLLFYYITNDREVELRICKKFLKKFLSKGFTLWFVNELTVGIQKTLYIFLKKCLHFKNTDDILINVAAALQQKAKKKNKKC